MLKPYAAGAWAGMLLAVTAFAADPSVSFDREDLKLLIGEDGVVTATVSPAAQVNDIVFSALGNNVSYQDITSGEDRAADLRRLRLHGAAAGRTTLFAGTGLAPSGALKSDFVDELVVLTT